MPFRLQITFLILFFFSFINFSGCASAPPVLIPSPNQVKGLAVVAQSEVGENVLGASKPIIITDSNTRETLFSLLELNKSDASLSSFDISSCDFVITWKLAGEERMDRSRLYLRLNTPNTFVYLSDLGSTTQKYTIRMDEEDAQKIWDLIGIPSPKVH
ncbi:MAG: hypothetical protein LBJ67_05925 [Planctomycetaceae bacterium]|jgi:hypothetical protein|nr:hypothetical protein [Planctomycetaceae bacterium]